MLNQLHLIDWIVLIFFLFLMPLAGILVSLGKKNSEDYFMAGHSLRWWAVAGSVFGTNINSSHLIGMLGIGYSVGFAQSHYELLPVAAILLLCYVFLPTYRRLKVFTLSQFLEYRYNEHARLVYTILMILLILVQLVAGFYIGSRTLLFLFKGTGVELAYWQGILIIGLMSCSYTIFGGLGAVVVTDTLQTLMMLLAGIIVAYFTFTQPEIGGFFGLLSLDQAQPLAEQKMHLYLPSNHPNLPWTGVFTGLIILHSFYFTTNQYLVQRVLAAKTDEDARIGIIASGFLKLTVPFFSIAAGVAAAYLFKIRFANQNILPDDAFLTLVGAVVPLGYGLTGMILAGLTAATFSSVDSMMNSVSTLLTLDVYKKYINSQASDNQMVAFGRYAVFGMVILSGFLAWVSYEPTSAGNFFLTVSAQGSYFTQGVLVAFLTGILWKRSNPTAAVIVMLIAPFFAFGIELLYNHWLAKYLGLIPFFGEKLNFLHRVLLTFLFCLSLQTILSWVLKNKKVIVDNVYLHTSSKDLLWIAYFVVVQCFLLLLIQFKIFNFKYLALPAGFLTMLLFCGICIVDNNKKRNNLLTDSRLYAGILSSITVFFLYYFF
ncbi:MAG: sodium/solute symporter [Microscillaceae bacterium]|nr:sodium/solute symporter [Microscillaceae bacterium]